MLDMLNRSGVAETNLVLPMLPYSRQDVQSGREPVMTKRLSKIFEDNKFIDSLITVDVHSRSAIDNAYDIKKELLFASKLILPVFLEEINGDISNLIFASTDEGGAKKANYFAKQVGVAAVVSIKERDKPNSVEKVSIKGEVEGKDVCFVDDMIDTGGTLVKAIEEASKRGAKNIYAICTHPLFNNAEIKFQNLYELGILKRIIGTDTINHSKEFLGRNKWFKQISVAELFAEVIFCSYMKRPVSSVYKPADKI
jgi:ribose-phosphate pyrophosphokinase